MIVVAITMVSIAHWCCRLLIGAANLAIHSCQSCYPQDVENWQSWWQLMKTPASLVMDATLIDKVLAAKDKVETVRTELRLLAEGSMVGSRIFSHYLANQHNIDLKAVLDEEIKAFMVQTIDNGKVLACRDKCLCRVRDMDVK
eukprot:10367764-Lingulodinium_polyedra.AAC.1